MARVFALTLLGTDTYHHEQKEAPLARTHTLSAVHDAFVVADDEHNFTHRYKPKDLQGLGDNEFSKVFSTSLKSNIKGHTKAVIDGADTHGKAVYHRVAMSTLMIMQQVALGATNVNINAHSRGAVQAILISHEIDRFKDIITANKDANYKDIYKLITQTKGLSTEDKRLIEQYTATRKRKRLLKRLIYKIQKDINKAEAKNCYSPINELKLDIFGIDPVPGTAPGVVTGKMLTWNNPKFYFLGKCVGKCHISYAEYEHSAGFQSIRLEDDPRLSVDSLPANHGTACGNLHYQAGLTAHIAGIVHHGQAKNLSHVQDLTFLNILDFMQNKQSIRFDPDSIQESELDQDELSRLEVIPGRDKVARIKDLCHKFNTELKDNPKAFDEEKLVLYKYIFANLPGYLRLRTGTYFFYIGLGNLGIRKYKDKDGKYCHRSAFIQVPKGFLSAEHHELFVAKRINELLKNIQDKYKHNHHATDRCGDEEIAKDVVAHVRVLFKSIAMHVKDGKEDVSTLVLNSTIKNDLNMLFEYVTGLVVNDHSTSKEILSQVILLMQEAEKYQNGYEVTDLIRNQMLKVTALAPKSFVVSLDYLSNYADESGLGPQVKLERAIEAYADFMKYINKLDKLRRIMSVNSSKAFDLFVSDECKKYLTYIYEVEHALRNIIELIQSEVVDDVLLNDEQDTILKVVHAAKNALKFNIDTKNILAYHHHWRATYLAVKNNSPSLVLLALADEAEFAFQDVAWQVAQKLEENRMSFFDKLKKLFSKYFKVPSNVTLHMAFSLTLTSLLFCAFTAMIASVLLGFVFVFSAVFITPAAVFGGLTIAALIGVLFFGAYLFYQSCYKNNTKEIDKQVAEYKDHDSGFESDVEEEKENITIILEKPFLITYRDGVSDLSQEETDAFAKILKLEENSRPKLEAA